MGRWDRLLHGKERLEYIGIKCVKYRSFSWCKPGVRQGFKGRAF